MSPVLVVAADGAKARYFTLEAKELAKGEIGAYLLEDESLVNPDQLEEGKELWSGPESQAGHYKQGRSTAHSYDDHREDHELENERRFARTITEQILLRTHTHPLQRLVIVAEPQLLGLLREVLIPKLPKALELTEIDKDLCHLRPHELFEYLTQRNLLVHV
jgi:protein required for attachment to host cells